MSTNNSTSTSTSTESDLAALVVQLRAELAAAKSAAAKIGSLSAAMVQALEESCTAGTVRPLGEKGNSGWNFSGRVLIGGSFCQVGINVIRKGGAGGADGAEARKAALRQELEALLAK
jgi:hypothetical protein